VTAWNEHRIARAIGRQTLGRRCVVLVDNCTWTGHECDVLAVTMDLRIIDVEIKISRADLKADAGKAKWWHRRDNWAFTDAGPRCAQHGAPAPDRCREWPPRVWKHYYALPAEIWDDALLAALPSKKSGVLLVRETRGAALEVSCRRRSTPNADAHKLTAAEALDIARLANLRMWDAYERAAKLYAPAMAEAA
jgi:hypothetical protein